jgi:hypothetical protein
MQQSVQTLAEMQARQGPTVIIPPKPRLLRVDMVKQNGKTSAVPVYEQQTLQ